MAQAKKKKARKLSKEEELAIKRLARQEAFKEKMRELGFEPPDLKDVDLSAFGRPTEYRPEYSIMLIEHLASGLSFETFLAKIPITSIKTLYNWCNQHEDFLQAKEVGEMLGQQFLETMGISGAGGNLPGFNQSAWKFIMANKYGWKARQDVTTDGKPIAPPPQVVIKLPSNGRE